MIDLSGFADEIKRHLNCQPYKIVCAECGGGLECQTEVDGDYDLSLTVSLCEHCTGGEEVSKK